MIKLRNRLITLLFVAAGGALLYRFGLTREARESVKKVIYDAVNVNAQQGKLMETAEFSLLFNTHDQREGMTAFGEKRPPVYTNN